MALLESFAQGREQVAHIVFVHRQIGMPRYPELRQLLDGAVGEQFLQVGTQHAGQRNQEIFPATQCEWQRQQAGQGARHLDDGNAVGTSQRILSAEFDDEVQ